MDILVRDDYLDGKEQNHARNDRNLHAPPSLGAQATRYLPADLFAKYRSIRADISNSEFYSNPKHRKTMEIWCAARFGRAYEAHLGPCALWVHDRDEQTDADVALEVNGVRYPFQITEVQKQDRRRGDEYRVGVLSSRTTVEDWDNGREQGPTWFRAAIERKLHRYGGEVSGLNLLVYLNYVAIEQPYFELQNAVAEVAARFLSVRVLNGNALACISTNSTALNGPLEWMFNPVGLDDDEH